MHVCSRAAGYGFLKYLFVGWYVAMLGQELCWEPMGSLSRALLVHLGEEEHV